MHTYIDGIYCYCDHWCERCSFTERCAVFTGTRLQPDGDPASPEFWQQALAHFAATHAGLAGEALELDIDVRPPTEAELEAAEQRQALIDARLSVEPLLRLAGAWQAQLLALMEDTPYWRRLARAAAQQATLGIRSPDAAMREAGEVTEYLHALRRYAEVVTDRISGALLCDFDEAEGLAGGVPEGLVKVALVSLDRSREALSGLYGIFADEDRMLPLFSLLGNLERAITTAYPGARAFVRPGFDEAPPLLAAS
ncbi:hypothetical protein EPD60_12690 [Flaviaesturariibacter flavus]|uniref:Uncharacterized protein n=1 Tax=Flaviaesturariibacter flavus TaxID=2502780 RepID=A0A4R1B8E4_9BACT|nr:hypothetical protein [Flaviaesturariibacter flavus]TCJ13248.1 hypothetical protein EPD60_12690 [Flaviaesturariibacter flavus]